MPLANFKCFLPNLRVRNVTKKVALNILTLLSVFANDGKNCPGLFYQYCA